MHPSREPGSPQPGLLLSVSGAYFKLSTPRHLKCQMPRQTKPGFFYFRGEVCRKSGGFGLLVDHTFRNLRERGVGFLLFVEGLI
jgi:hypothetical protein